MPILSGRFGILVWGIQSQKGQPPSATDLSKSFGIVRDVRVRVPAGTTILRGVGTLAAAGIVVTETATDAPEMTITIEGVGGNFKELCEAAQFRPANDPVFPRELPYLSVVFGDDVRGTFVMVDCKISRLEVRAPADRYAEGSVTLRGRFIDTITSAGYTLPSIPTQVFLSKEGTLDWGEASEFTLRVDNRIDARHVLKPSQPPSGRRRIPDYLVEIITEIGGTVRAFWYGGLADLKADYLSSFTITYSLQDFADPTKTLTFTVPGAKATNVNKTIPAEREIEIELDFQAVSWQVS